MEAPQPAWEIFVRACTVTLSKTGLCGRSPQTGPRQLEARPWPLPGTVLPGTWLWAPPELLGSGRAGCYQQQSKEGQVVTAADSPLGSDLCGAALGRPVSR